jgi:hypothetical protein
MPWVATEKYTGSGPAMKMVGYKWIAYFWEMALASVAAEAIAKRSDPYSKPYPTAIWVFQDDGTNTGGYQLGTTDFILPW